MGEFDVVIVGNGVAGYACARSLARRGRRPLIAGPGLPFDRPPLSKAALVARQASPQADAKGLADEGIELLDGEVVDGDLGRRTLSVDTGREVLEISASAIVIAVGLTYEPVPVPGLGAAHVNATVDGFHRLATALDPAGAGRGVVIVGAGLIGVETAATLAIAGYSVTIGDIVERPLDRLHDPLPAVASSTLETVGARFLAGLRVTSVDHRADGSAAIETESHGTLEADILIAATGARQRSVTWLDPLPYQVSDDMSVPGYAHVYAIGDCCAPPHARFGRIQLPHWDIAIATAERAAAAICEEPGVYDRLPYWWSDLGSTRIAELGYAAHVVEWSSDGSMHTGRDADGVVVCATVVGERRRLAEARSLFQPAQSAA